MNTTNITKNLSSETLNWSEIQTRMRGKLGKEIYESWLKKIDFIEEFNNYVLLSVPTRFIRDWITSRYLDQILQIIKNYKKEIVRIEFKIVDKQSENILEKKQNTNLKTQENISFIKDSICNTTVSMQTRGLTTF